MRFYSLISFYLTRGEVMPETGRFNKVILFDAMNVVVIAVKWLIKANLKKSFLIRIIRNRKIISTNFLLSTLFPFLYD